MFDYRLDDAGISSTEDDDEEEDENKQVATGLPPEGGKGRVRLGCGDFPLSE